MDNIENYFKKLAKNVNFIELKDYTQLDMDLEESEEIPLPLVSDILAEGISTGKLAEEVNVEMIIDGMIYLLGTDSQLELSKKYLEILKRYNEKIDDYIFFKGIQFLDQGMDERSSVYFRALSILNPNHILGRFNYALALERIGQEYLNNNKLELGDEFIDASTLEFEYVLDINEEYPLAYYKLGYHYSYRGQNLKAKLMWEKYLNLDDDDLRKQEIREQIDMIEEEVLLEAGITYLSYNRYEEALESFLKLLPSQENWWELRYLIGNTYAGMNKGNLAIEEYYKALELNSQVEDVYNELGIELFKEKRYEEAIKVYSMGIENLDSSYKLYYNRALTFIQLNMVEEAYIDAKKAYELNSIEENVRILKEEIEKIL